MSQSDNDLNPYRPPEKHEDSRREPVSRYRLVEKTPPVPSRIAFGFSAEVNKVMFARFSSMTSAMILYALSSLPIGVILCVLIFVPQMNFHRNLSPIEEVFPYASILLLIPAYFSWLLTSCVRFVLKMIRGEPEEPGSYFGIGNARNFLRSIGVMLAWLPCVAVFVCCSVWFIVLIDSSHVGEYTTITYLMIALAVVFGLVPASTITGFFGIALFFMIDNDDSWGRGVANAWKFGKNNLVSITLHSLAIPVLIVFLSTVFCFGLFVFAGVFPCLYLNLGMLYIGITGQKHCKSPIEDEPDEW